MIGIVIAFPFLILQHRADELSVPHHFPLARPRAWLALHTTWSCHGTGGRIWCHVGGWNAGTNLFDYVYAAVSPNNVLKQTAKAFNETHYIV